MLFIRKSGRQERDPSISQASGANAGSNPFQQAAAIPGAVFDARSGQYKDASGRVISQDMANAIIAAQAAKSQGVVQGKAVGEEAAKDVPMSQQTIRDTENRVAQGVAKIANVTAEIDRAISQVDWTSAGLAAAFKDVGGPPANLAAAIETIGANIGLNELLELKGRGGTLGQVTQAEHTLLQSLLTSMKQQQDPKVLRDKLKDLKREVKASWARVNDALKADLAARGPGDAQSAENKPRIVRRWNSATGRLE
jgi:hypothetical protein